MLRQFLILAFAVALGGEALPLFVAAPVECACAVKSACCRMNMCPLKAAPEQAGGTRLRSCTHSAPAAGVASFLRWRAMAPVTSVAVELSVLVPAVGSDSLRPLDGVWFVAERPPWTSFLVAA
jgi:hypothetical protein